VCPLRSSVGDVSFFALFEPLIDSSVATGDQSEEIYGDPPNLAGETGRRARGRTLYDILGIPHGVSVNRVKDSYRLLTNKTPITEGAYSVLSDPAKKQQYDAELSAQKKAPLLPWIDQWGSENWSGHPQTRPTPGLVRADSDQVWITVRDEVRVRVSDEPVAFFLTWDNAWYVFDNRIEPWVGGYPTFGPFASEIDSSQAELKARTDFPNGLSKNALSKYATQQVAGYVYAYLGTYANGDHEGEMVIEPPPLVPVFSPEVLAFVRQSQSQSS
jgi:hypothetical protein